MKRDMDLVRAILLELESSEKPLYYQNEGHNIYSKLNAYDIKLVWYHLQLLEEAALIRFYETGNVYQISETEWEHERGIGHLTWEGHEFLDSARDNSRWNQAKEIVKEKGGGLTFDVIKAVLIKLGLQAVGLG